jgi:hypothetical protein
MRSNHLTRCGTTFVVVLIAALLSQPLVHACTVFFAFDGRMALAGQNEDWNDYNTQMWVVPRTATTYGAVYFGFGRGDYPEGGIQFSPRLQQILNGRIDLIKEVTDEDGYGLPQQGVNEKGLFFGSAETDPVAMVPQPGLTKYDGHLVDLIMRRCATAAEALSVLQSHDYIMPKGHLLFGDKSGDSFVMEAGRVIVRRTSASQVITNFLQSREPQKKATDRRYRIATDRLQSAPELSPQIGVEVLDTVRQSNTRYSIVVNLTEGTVSVYRSGKFDQAVELNVAAEIAKGPRAAKIADLFRR